MRSAHQKLAISIVIVALYTTVPVLAGWSAAAPKLFRYLLGGVPLSVWFILLLLFCFPVIAWICSNVRDSDTDGN
jgi:hypothetical protein